MKHQPPIKILYIDHTAQLGGGELALLNLIQHLDRERFEPQVLLFSDGPLADALRKENIPVHLAMLDPAVNKTTRHAAGRGRSLRLGIIFTTTAFIMKLRREISRIKPDIVHTNSLKADLLGGIAARAVGVKLIWHIRDRIETDYLPKKVAVVFRKSAKHLPHMVIANSHSTLATLKLPKSKPSAVVYSGMSDPHPDQSSAAPAEAPAGCGGKVIMVGRISPWKGQDVFIRAAAIVHKSRPDVRFEIVGSALFGEDAYEAQIYQLVKSLGLQEIVSFLGFRKDIPELIAAADLLVHASTSPEPFGQVVVQAMAAGKPVVATRGGGVLETVAENETGLLVPMGDADAMAAAILKVLADPAKAAAMGTAGHRRYLEKFTIEQTATAVQNLYTRIAKSKGKKKAPASNGT